MINIRIPYIVPSMTYLDCVTSNVKAEMGRASVTQKQLAEQLDLTQASLSSRLRGKIEFKPSELEKIANFLGIEVEVLTSRPKLKASA